MRSSFFLPAVAVIAIALTGCTASPSTREPDDGVLTAEKSPLSEYIDVEYSAGLSPEDEDKADAAAWDKSEEIIAACMNDEGFEYTPTAYVSEDSFTAAVEEWEPDDKNWVAEWGYGITDIPARHLSADEVEPDGTGTNPNVDYLGTLSPVELEAYMEALDGPPADPEELVDGENVYNWEESGCSGLAQHEVAGDQDDLSEFDGLWDRIHAFEDDIFDAPEFADLDAAWSSCMSDAGESGFTRQEDAWQSITAAMPEPQEAPEGGSAAAEYENPMDDPVVAELHEREIELALIDLECRTKTDYYESALRIQFELEEQFIAENKAELDAYKLAAEQAG